MLAEHLPPLAPGTLRDGSEVLSWTAFFDRVDQRAAALSAIRPHQLVLAPCRNRLDDLVTLAAILERGAIAVPCNPRFSQGQRGEIRRHNAFTWQVDDDGLQPLGDGTGPADMQTGIFTSGSTGVPKLVCHGLDQHLANATRAADINPVAARDCWHLSLPLFHIGGLAVFFRALRAGCSLVLGGRVEDATFLAREGITHASMVATQLRRLLAIPLPPLALKSVLVGGGPVPAALLDTPLPLRLTYGMSEMGSQVCTQGPDGRMHWLCQWRVDDSGALELAGPTRCLGYLEGNRLHSPGEWLATGDIVEWQREWLRIVGRRDNQFISGGENIQPEQIERALTAQAGVRQAIVVPVACPEYGQRPFAFLDGELDTPLDLAGYLQPVGYAPLPPMQGLKPSRDALTREANRHWCQTPG